MSFTCIALISAGSIVQAVVWVVVAGLVFWLLTWLIDYAGLPEPFSKIGKVILAVAAVVILVDALFRIAGKPLIDW